MPAWTEGTRKDPKPCREQDRGKFEVTQRDGRARLGKLHTEHGILETPALLPVVNPNIRTIEPRVMWDKYGIGALITNSYIIWKHDDLKVEAQQNGVHSLLNFPGVVMTDSGTFQSYMYGDVEVGVEEIVSFQKSIGVDIATMLDVFSRPDMTEKEVEEAVHETVNRATVSVEASGETMLNGPIQGGVFRKLRQLSAQLMSEHDFSVHPIGGIVPVMEQQRYKDYAKIMMAALPNLPPNRPVHMFGCGHPMLFPMSIALGADLFDSAAYALFARDGRLLTPWGTERIDDLVDWPMLMPCVAMLSPADVRSMPAMEKEKCLAHYNLEVTLAELARCKQAVRDGKIWQLAEQRSHQHPALREAFLWLSTRPAISGNYRRDLFYNDREAAKDLQGDRGMWEDSWDWVVWNQQTPRVGGIQWSGDDTFVRPHIQKARRAIHTRWTTREETTHTFIFHGIRGPFRDRLLDQFIWLQHHIPAVQTLMLTPLGLIPIALEDVNPFAHVNAPEWVLDHRPDDLWIKRELERLGIGEIPYACVDARGDGIKARMEQALERLNLPINMLHMPIDNEDRKAADATLNLHQAIEKMMVMLNMDRAAAETIAQGASYVANRQGRVKNVLDSNGIHILSPRLRDGGLSLTNAGATHIFNQRKEPLPNTIPIPEWNGTSGNGPAIVVVEPDAEPYVRQGRNVFHGFVTACDRWILPGESCLIVNQQGHLLGHGISQCNADEICAFTKGIAIKTRGGLLGKE